MDANLKWMGKKESVIQKLYPKRNVRFENLTWKHWWETWVPLDHRWVSSHRQFGSSKYPWRITLKTQKPFFTDWIWLTCPLTFSLRSTEISLLANLVDLTSPKSTPHLRATALAKAGWELPPKIRKLERAWSLFLIIFVLRCCVTKIPVWLGDRLEAMMPCLLPCFLLACSLSCDLLMILPENRINRSVSDLLFL